MAKSEQPSQGWTIAWLGVWVAVLLGDLASNPHSILAIVCLALIGLTTALWALTAVCLTILASPSWVRKKRHRSILEKAAIKLYKLALVLTTITVIALFAVGCFFIFAKIIHMAADPVSW